jgi:lycopene beta-cyclase
VLVAGGGPAGRALAAACGERGLRTALLDPAPDRPWPATYGAWADELPPELPASVLAATSPARAIGRVEHDLDRDYAVLDTQALRVHLDGRMAGGGVDVRRGRARPGERPAAAVVVDAAGAGQPLSERTRQGQTARPRAEQTAFGLVVPAEVAAPLACPRRALFMDWRTPDGAPPDPAAWPTFLYAVPLGADRMLLEETSLARRPGLPFAELERRLRTRLRRHGVAPPPGASREHVRFPLDLPRHRCPGVLGFGAAAPLTHPATGYQLATALRLAPAVGAALADGLADGPSAALRQAADVLWPAAARAAHLLRRRGLESLLRLPSARLPEFFDGFFTLPPRRQRAYLSGRDDPVGIALAMAAMFRTTPWPVRLRLIGSSLLVSPVPVE